MLLTKSQAARRINKTPQAIHKAIISGRLPVVRDSKGREMIDAGQLDRLYGLAPGEPPKRTAPVEAPRYAAVADVPEYAESKARTEFLKAELLDLERRQKEGQLIEAEKLKRDSFALGTQVKELLMGIADRLAHMCAAEDDPTRIHEWITEEHRNALRAFCDAD